MRTQYPRAFMCAKTCDHRLPFCHAHMFPWWSGTVMCIDEIYIPGKNYIPWRLIGSWIILYMHFFFNGTSFRCAIKNDRWFPAKWLLASSSLLKNSLNLVDNNNRPELHHQSSNSASWQESFIPQLNLPRIVFSFHSALFFIRDTHLWLFFCSMVSKYLPLSPLPFLWIRPNQARISGWKRRWRV